MICDTAWWATKQTPRNGRVSKGKKNGDLLRAAEIGGYAVLLTVDQGMPQQIIPRGRKIAILLLVAPSNQMEDLLPLVPDVLVALQSVQPGQVIRLAT